MYPPIIFIQVTTLACKTRNWNIHLLFSAPILTLYNQGTSKMSTVPQNPNEHPKNSSSPHLCLSQGFLSWNLIQRLTMWQKHADSIICAGRYQRKVVHEVWPLEIMLPSGVHVRRVRAKVFCLNPISIRFQYQCSLWLLILHHTISKSLICLPGPLLALFPSLHLPSSLALISHGLREAAGNQILNPLLKV